MKLLFIADPMERLKPLGDSSLALVRAALGRRWEVSWTTPETVVYAGDHVAVTAAPVKECGPEAAGRLGTAVPSRLDTFDGILIRKDPPFDAAYVKLCWLLALEESRVFQMNRPSRLLRYHEKLSALEALAQGYLRPDDVIPTFIGDSAGAARFLRGLGVKRGVAKPFLGFGGLDVELFEGVQPPAGEDLIVQPFLETVRDRGDRRVIFLEGEVLAHFTRLPPEGSIVSNLARGGRAAPLPLLPREEESLRRLGAFLKAAGIFFAGADLIGHYVSEVNITSPTGLRSLEKLEGNDYTAPILDAIARGSASMRSGGLDRK